MIPFAPKIPGELASFALGCMNFGRRTPRAEALAIIDAALDAGIAVLDTANAYTDGESERIVGAALRGRREGARVASKAGLGPVPGKREGLSPARVLAACDESLARLDCGWIDLYYLHAPDPDTPPELTLTALGELLAAGKIRAWGVSNFASWQILELRGLAAAMGLPAPVAAQQLYNPLLRELDIEYFAFARRFPIHTTVYNPLAGGLLTGRHRFEARAPKGSRFDNPMYRRRYWQAPLFRTAEALAEVAEKEGLSLVELSYAWALGRPGVDSVLVGPGSLDHLEAALAARGRRLSPEALAAVDAAHVALVGTDAHYAR